MLGGLSWFAVPWAFASCLGLAARALVNNVSTHTHLNISKHMPGSLYHRPSRPLTTISTT